MRLPTTIICGFLGAGKTTLLNQLLRRPGGERLAVLVNDFGTINIDRDLIRAETRTQIELTNGCVCCSIQDDLAAALMSVYRGGSQYTRIVLECSGVSHPAGVLKIFESEPVQSLFKIDGIFCVIDALNFQGLDYRSTELAIDQAAMSDVVLLNKCDVASEDVRSDVRRTLLAAQRRMRLIDVVECKISTELLFGSGFAERRMFEPRMSGDDHHADYETLAFEWVEAVEVEPFQRLDDALPAGVLRAKGILGLPSHDGEPPRRAVYQRVGKRSSLATEIGPGPTVSRLVVIARRGELDRDQVQSAVNHCPGARRLVWSNRRKPEAGSIVCS